MGLTIASELGMAFGDVDLDGDLDLIGVRVAASGSAGPNYVLHNDGFGAFETTTAGLPFGHPSSTTGHSAVVGDVNNDGWPDILVSHTGPDSLYMGAESNPFAISHPVSPSALDEIGRAHV